MYPEEIVKLAGEILKMFYLSFFFLHLQVTVKKWERERAEGEEKDRFVTKTLFLCAAFFSLVCLSLSRFSFYVSNNVVSCFRLDKYTHRHQMKYEQM